MARKPDPYLVDQDNPEWTDEDFANARPASEVLPPDLYAALLAGKIEIVPDPSTVRVELDGRVVDAFKAKGPGWEARINDTLKKAVGL